jgi:hypothetical protein
MSMSMLAASAAALLGLVGFRGEVEMSHYVLVDIGNYVFWAVVLAVQVWIYLGIIRRFVKKIQSMTFRILIAAAWGALTAIGFVGAGHGVIPIPAVLGLFGGGAVVNRISVSVSVALLVIVELLVSLRAARSQRD